MILFGEKIGMTRIFLKNKGVPVTVIKAGPCPIVFIKSKDKYGYNAVEIGYGKNKKITKSIKGHLKNSKVDSVRHTCEVSISDDDKGKYKLGDIITIDSFKVGDKVDVSGTSKGKGFAGVMKRHGFSGMPASHGHEKQRIPGSIGCCYPQRVIKGKKMAGQMGNKSATVRRVIVCDIDKENNLIAVKGSVPGTKKGIVQIKSI